MIPPTKSFPNITKLSNIIFQADKQHFENRLIEVLNWIGDLAEKTAAKYGTDSQYYQKAVQARRDIANYNGLVNAIIQDLQEHYQEAYYKGYANGIEDSKPPVSIRQRVDKNFYKLLRSQTSHSFHQGDFRQKELLRKQSISKTQQQLPNLY